MITRTVAATLGTLLVPSPRHQQAQETGGESPTKDIPEAVARKSRRRRAPLASSGWDYSRTQVD
jgi:hypothetical protein